MLVSSCSQIKDVLIVWALLVVFLMAFAITSQAILYEGPSNLGYDTLAEMIGRAYWPMFGEYNMDEWDQGEYCPLALPCPTLPGPT